METINSNSKFPKLLQEKRAELRKQIGKQDLNFKDIQTKLFKLGYNHYDVIDEEQSTTLVAHELVFNCGIDGTPLNEKRDSNIYFFIRLTSLYKDDTTCNSRKDYIEFGAKQISKQILFYNSLKEDYVVMSETIINKILVFNKKYYEKIFSDALSQLVKLTLNQEGFSSHNDNLPDFHIGRYPKRMIYSRRYEQELNYCLMLTTMSAIIPNDSSDSKDNNDINNINNNILSLLKSNKDEDKTDPLVINSKQKEGIVCYYNALLHDTVLAGRNHLDKNNKVRIELLLPNARTEFQIYYEKKSDLKTITSDDKGEDRINLQKYNASQLKMTVGLNDDIFSEERFYGGITFDDIYTFLLECENEFRF